MQNYLQEKLSVLVVGYDGYIDVWNHCFNLMNRFWKERPRTILANSELRPVYDDVEIVNAGPGSEWSERTREGLKQIETEYVLLLLEDFFIGKAVDNINLENAIRLMESEGLDYYQIKTQSKGKISGKAFKNHQHIYMTDTYAQYPINLQAAIWRKSFLLECIGEGNYNAWVFEFNHINDMVNTSKCTCVIDGTDMLHIIHGVVQSKYLRSAKKKLKKLGCIIPEDEREQLSILDNLKYRLKQNASRVIPQCMYAPAKKIGRMMKIDFVSDRYQGDGR